MLHPDAEYLSLCREILEEEADYYEVSPETLWDVDARGNLVPSQVTDVFLEIKRRSGKPFVGHGLGLSPGTAATNPQEDARLQKWLARIREDQKLFEYQWYTEHLGWESADGLNAVLPLPLPPTEESAQVVASRLSLLKPIIPLVGFENQVTYFTFGDARDEPPFWNRMCELGDLWLLLDLHNAYTQCLNCGVSLDEYLGKLDLSRVIEIHLSGGSESEAGWLPSGRVMRIDTHDNPIPEGVWEAFEKVRPRCKNLRGVTVERLNETIEKKDVPLLRDEVRRAKGILKSEYRNPKSEGNRKEEMRKIC